MPTHHHDFIVRLTHAIDQQDTAALRQVIQDYPNEDYNQVTESGLSALWLALTPPSGESISTEIVTVLLEYMKNDGHHLINPTQAYRGVTPRQYIYAIKEFKLSPLALAANQVSLNRLINLMTRAEDYYRAPPVAQVPQFGMRDIANDNQNAHNHHVVELARENIQRLYQHYVVNKGYRLESVSLKEIEDAIAKLENNRKRQQVKKGLLFCCQSTAQFSLKLERLEFHITLGELIGLMALAIEDDNKDVGVADLMQIEAKEARLLALFETLYDIATAYGVDAPSCQGGAYNRLGLALAATHQLVKSTSREPLNGAEAQQLITHFLGKQLQQLSEQSLPKYWCVLRHQLFNDPEVEDNAKIYNQYVTDKIESWRAELINNKNVAVKEVEESLSTLSISMPVEAHVESWQLYVLLSMLMIKEPKVVVNLGLCQDKALAQALSDMMVKATSELHNSCRWQNILNRLGLTVDIEFTHAFLKMILKLARQDIVCFDAFCSLWRSGQDFSLEAREQIVNSLLLTVFYQHRQKLINVYPNQRNWINGLNDKHILALLTSLLKQQKEKFPWHDVSILVPQMIESALKIGYLSHLSFANIIFKGKDFRGFRLMA